MSVLICHVSRTSCCITRHFTRVEVFVVVHAQQAVSTYDEEDSNQKEKNAANLPYGWRTPSSNQKGGGQENVEISLSSSGLQEQEVVFHEREIPERQENHDPENYLVDTEADRQDDVATDSIVELKNA